MNLFGAVVFFTLLLTFFVKLVSELLNLKASEAGVPDEFIELFDEEAYRKSRDYLSVSTRFSLFAAAVDLSFLLLFWFAGGFNLLDQFLRGYGYSPIVCGVLYIGALLLMQTVIDLPFSLYKTFVIEAKFGFNKTTPAVFVADLLKTILLSLLLGIPLLAAVLWFFETAGSMAWLLAWGGITMVSLLLQYIAPTWIMPLFNKFVPLEEGDLKSAIMQYAAKVEFPLSGIFVLDGSKRSAKANAFFTGFGKRKRIALFDTLIEAHPVHELVAVLAHEIGHFKKKHIIVNLVLSFCNLGALFFLLSLVMNNRSLFDAFFMKDLSVYGSLIFFSLLYTPVEWILSLLLQLLSRKHEYEADAYAVSTFERGTALADALKKLSRNNLSNLTPHPFYVFLNYSHPPVLQRIMRIREYAADRDANS
ncbi:M48 family metallopeptidase [Pelodictyon phaeoclathratiforme]|jgi:STE24 endopeptidase|uniref:Ste24 endopeptidase n=1 Tax=Pelodictyon phaeoclathratiforme (strain DSM 5477 / BU-1) TaxID=324925 RepID=B4SFQ6_PELPB|nr:M48 family metallopeptidase [Pelodictyon phaeoclathratiforme]ACF43311.1 Ste24 endopeptidase [Pelodictyon phaeoclathratiforme BU-1]MBV5290350.1 M48 family metallopeptidase [Pelodictyon phaeoclathratiforme]